MTTPLAAKLRPDRFTAMSGKMAAIVGYIVGERFSDPAISELVVTSDGSWPSTKARSEPTTCWGAKRTSTGTCSI